MSFVLGVLAPCLLGQKVQDGLDHARVIDSPKASGYKRFVKKSDDRFLVTFFNISNAPDVLSTPGAKPLLQEIGPFVYNYHRIRINVTFDMDGERLSFHQHKWIEFNQEETSALTGGRYVSDTDVKITTINMIFLGMRIQAGRSYWHAISDMMLWHNDSKRLFEERTPRELLQGYSVAVNLPFLPTIQLKFPGLHPNLVMASDPDMKSPSKIRSGAANPADTLAYQSWREQTSVRVKCPYGAAGLPFDEQCKLAPYPCCGQREPVPVWDTLKAPGEFDEDANAVQGTTGGQFRPGLHADTERVVAYLDLAQRAFPMVTTPGEGPSHYHGVALRRFRPDPKLLWANSKERSANARYYQWGPSGLLNLTVLFGTDVFVSLPHFLNCDPSLLEAVDGLKPDPGLHDLYIGVEPYSGITLTEQERVMISTKIAAEPEVPGFDEGWFPALQGRTVYVPVAWFNTRALATTEDTDFYAPMYKVFQLQIILRVVGISCGIMAVTSAVALIFCWARNKKSERQNSAGALLQDA